MTTHYQPWLVALSLIVAIVAFYTALNLTGRMSTARSDISRLWLLVGSVTLGVGIWSMHFIGMLAYAAPIPLRYDLGITLLSLAAAIATSGLALSVASHPRLSRIRLAISALLMGAGIVALHYTGMAAITVKPAIQYRVDLLIASVVIAVAASYAALWLVFQLSRGGSRSIHIIRAAASVVMGLAVAGVHYTGMAAMSLMPGAYCATGLAPDNLWTAVTIGLLALGMLTVALITALYDGHLEQQELRERRRFQHLSTHDPLTGLPNRSSLKSRLEELLDVSLRAQRPFAVLMIDLNRFRQVNDTQGQRVGDKALREVARQLDSLARSSDVVARFGGDQFAMLLNAPTDWHDAERVGQRINVVLSQSMRDLAPDFRLSASVGISMFPLHGDTADGLLANAETAMLHAKQSGYGAVCCFTPEMDQALRERLSLENDLRHALELEQFELHYQPKIDDDGHQVRSAEALLRWRHPTRGTVPPDRFIPVAEASGLIQDMNGA